MVLSRDFRPGGRALFLYLQGLRGTDPRRARDLPIARRLLADYSLGPLRECNR